MCLDLCKQVDNHSLIGSEDLDVIYHTLSSVQPVFLQLYNNCLKKHPHPKIYYERGMIYFHQGSLMDSLCDIRQFIDLAEESQEDLVDSELYLQEGKSYAELGLYDDAIRSLSNSIQKDSENKEAYFERATCYFEKSLYEQSIQDFLDSGFSTTKIDPEDFSSLDFAAGLIKASAFTAAESIEDFGPSVCSSVSGLTNGLWTFVTSPKECSVEVIESCKEIASLILDNSAYENLRLLFPEIGDLAENWDSSSSFMKGELMGKIIGKYGTDVLLVGGSLKLIKAYRNLRNANNLMTIEGMAKALKNDKLVELSKNWQNQTKKAIESATKDLSGRELCKKLRHITDENQLRKALHKHGIKTFERPKGIPKDWGIKITDKGGGMKYYDSKNPCLSVRVMPGNPNSPNLAQRKPYVVQRIGEKALDKYGNQVCSNSFEAHVSIKEYIFRE